MSVFQLLLRQQLLHPGDLMFRFFLQDVVTSEMTEDKNRVCHVMEETGVDVQIRQTKAQPQANNNRPHWSNGNGSFFICCFR